jgi:hypothetical protein
LDNFEEEVALAEKYTQLRILHVGRGESETVQIEIGTNIERLWSPLDNGMKDNCNISTLSLFFCQRPWSGFLPSARFLVK